MTSKRPPLRILIVGPMPPPYTGTTTLLEYLVDILGTDPSVKTHVVNTLGIRGKGLTGVFRFLGLLRRTYALARRSDVVTLHCSTTGLHVIGLAVYLVARAARKPLIVRKFAGDDYMTTLGGVGRRIAEFVLRRSDLYLAESKLLVAAAEARGIAHVEWYPNSRPVPPVSADSGRARGPCRRFVYIGRIVEAKGMRVMADAAAGLPAGLTIDVYGPWGNDLPRDLFEPCPNIRYHGPLLPEAIIPTFQQYDASLLPTHYIGEGYPGAILESYLAGVPVITTRWRAIPEIVDDSVGIMVEAESAVALRDGMVRLANDEALYQSLCANTRAKAEFFSADGWAAHFVERCRDVARLRTESPASNTPGGV